MVLTVQLAGHKYYIPRLLRLESPPIRPNENLTNTTLTHFHTVGMVYLYITVNN